MGNFQNLSELNQQTTISCEILLLISGYNNKNLSKQERITHRNADTTAFTLAPAGIFRGVEGGPPREGL